MNDNGAFAIGFLGILGAILVINQVSTLYRTLWQPISRWLTRHIVLPRLFHGRHLFNPTRVEVLCHLIHWVATILYNTCGVTSLSQAASRAAQIAIIHIVPLLVSYQLGSVARALGLSLNAVLKIHQSVAVMATVQGALHGLIQLLIAGGWKGSMVFKIMGVTSLLVLSILPLVRRYSYEVFLYSHRAITIALIVALWEHIRSRQSLSRTLLVSTFGVFIASTIFQNARQIYKNTAWGRHGIRLVSTSQVRHCDESLIVEIRLPRPWKIQPGEYIYLSLLTWKCASLLQRHPFMITWWENADDKDKAHLLYIMIDPQQGWTQSVMARQSVFTDQIAWLDGPFGTPHRLEEYGTVILFASGNGIFAQLPLLKGLAEGFKTSAVKTRRIKLIWQTDHYHEQLQEWIQSILSDSRVDKEFLDISIHTPASEELKENNRMGNSKIREIGRHRRLRIINDVADVERYIELELEESRKSVAVTVSGHRQLRHDVRREVLRMKRYNVRLFELDYQPVYTDRHKGGTAA